MVLGLAVARFLTRATAISPQERVSPSTAKQSCVLFSTTVSIRLIASSSSSSSSSSAVGRGSSIRAEVQNLPLGGLPPFGLLLVELGERSLPSCLPHNVRQLLHVLKEATRITSRDYDLIKY